MENIKESYLSNVSTVVELDTFLTNVPILSVGTFVLLIRSCAQKIASSFWRMEVAQVVEKMDNARKKERKNG
jgi:hypothetical protein